MKRLLAILFVSGLLIACTCGTAYAHTLKIDGAIGVTLHSDPNDDLKAGRVTTFNADIQDKTKRFNPASPSECNCTFAIQKDGQTIVSMPLASGNIYNRLQYTFKDGGIYNLVVSGQPKTAGLFQPFSVSFSSYARAADGSSTPAQNQLTRLVPFVVLALGVVLLLLVIDPTNIRRKHQS